MKILLELHGAFNTASRLAPICSALHGQNFGLIWDLAHSYRAGEDYRELWRELSLYIKHIHIKDLKRGKNGDLELCTQGEGEIPVPETVRMLLDDGYTGYFSLEYEKAWHPSLPDSETEIEKYVKYMKSI